MKKYTFDVVIATRNRTDALSLSIPLILSQSRLPEKVIVVDSSDNPGPVREIVERNAASCDISFKFIRSKAGSTLQRNIGLKEVTADVVFFPDDDSLLQPGALEAMMRIYDLDEDGVVGGVCGRGAREAPKGMEAEVTNAYAQERINPVWKIISFSRYVIENNVFRDPYLIHGEAMFKRHNAPAWLESENAVPIYALEGYRMSFRSNAIKEVGFEEDLREYALGEDMEASFSVSRKFLLVMARNAAIYHHKFPGPRQDGKKSGVTQILNRAFIICKHAEISSIARSRLMVFSCFKVIQFAMRIKSNYGCHRFLGAYKALCCVPELMREDQSELSKRYQLLLERCLH